MSTEKYMDQIYELLESIGQSVEPDSTIDDLLWLRDRKLRDALYGKHPKCFMGFKGMQSKNREIPFFPICNRDGAYDPRVVGLSIKLANKMKEYGRFNNKHLDLILVKLIDMKKKNGDEDYGSLDQFKYPGTGPTSFQEKLFYKIKSYLDMVV
jgi:hypothetical protein